MRILSLILITHFVSLSIISLGQSKTSKRDRLNEYKNRITDYVPKNVTQHEVLFVDLGSDEVRKRIKNAHYLSYFQNGIDTLSGPKAFLDTELESFRKSEEKGANFQNLKDLKKLRKMLKLTVITSDQLDSFDVKTHRYLLDIDFTSSKESPEAVGFVINLNLFFVDRLTGKEYMKIDDSRISIADLME